MESREVVKGKKWILYPEGKETITLIVDGRMKPLTKWGSFYKGGAISDYGKREIRVAPKGVSQTAVGHEVGHIVLEHGKGESRDTTRLVGEDFIREELEAEYWAYSMGFPKRKSKILDLKDLGLELGMTSTQFTKLHKLVKGRFKEAG